MKPPAPLKKLGIQCIDDSPLYLPTGIEDNRNLLERFEPFLMPAGTEVVCAGVVKHHETKWSNGKPRLVITLTDYFDTVQFALFGDQRKLSEHLDTNEKVQLYAKGEVSYFNRRMFLNNTKLLMDDEVGSLKPVYPGIRGVISAASAKTVIQEFAPASIEPCAEKLVSELSVNQKIAAVLTKIIPYGVIQLCEELRALHCPASINSFDRAKKTLTRIATLQAANFAMQGNVSGLCESINGPGQISELSRHIPFNPTDEQQSCALSVVQKMAIGERSHSLLVGDVGTGKTAVIGMIARYVLLAGAQRRVVIMLPNEALAHQIFNEVSSYIPEVSASLFAGDIKGDIASQLLIGTTSLLFAGIPVVDLCVVDEAQKFSREQREKIQATHLLESSATPIPRTAALAQFGAVDVLTLRKAHTPKDVTTSIYFKEDADDLMWSVQDTLNRGAKVLIVCPKREGSGTQEKGLYSAEQIAYSLDQQFPGRVRMMHSGLSSEENERVLNEFKNEIDLLVSTSKIEVGVTVKNLRHVVVYGAERFGLTVLHQIRGRVARIAPEDGTLNWGKFDLFLPNGAKEKTMERLNALVQSNDGFAISELDMKLRGIGDLTTDSEKQHGTTSVGVQNVFLEVDKIAAAIEYVARH
ncbi:MAG: hypothetical protein CMF12_04020 [Idiomarina sp.]|uniref:helicase-related protein n=1 Tax=Idiomarina sp. TaxID=1874361 RepID=UPI000C6A3998|nr:helicase-related protein [Idiomarina sp.]MBT41670.1 hypothetical protein [Idiomarina sp.]